MTGFSIFLRKELREASATNRMLIVAIFFAFFGLSSPLLAKYTPELLQSIGNGVQIIVPTPTAKDAIDQFLKNVGGNGIFAALLLAIGAVAREKERGTAAFALTKPLTLEAFLAAKFASLALLLALGVALGGIATYIYTILLFHEALGAGFWLACVLVWLSLLAYTALTFLGSVLARTTIMAAGLGIVAFVLLSLVGVFPNAAQFTPGGLFDTARALSLGQVVPHPTQSIVATLGWVAVPLMLAWVSFRSQELAQVDS